MEYVEAIRRHWLIALLVVVAVMAPTAVANLRAPAQYTAMTRLWVGIAGGSGVTDLSQKVSVAADLMSSYPEIVRSPAVLDPVITQLGLTDTAAGLGNRVVASVPNDTLVLQINVTDGSPVRAAAIANAVAVQFGVVVGALPQLGTNKSAEVEATVLQTALPPESPASPQVVRNLGVALVLSLVLAIIVCLVVDRYLPDDFAKRRASKANVPPQWD